MKKVKHEDGEIFGIIGLGRFGSSLAVSLANAGLDVIVIDRDEAAVRRVRDHVQSAYLCDELTTDNLMEAGIQNCDVVVVCIGSHIDRRERAHHAAGGIHGDKARYLQGHK